MQQRVISSTLQSQADLVAQAEGYCQKLIEGFDSKANHNKRELLVCFMAAVICTTATPLFITLGPEFFWGKVVPSVLSAVATAATAWLQLRKPQHLWAMYRTAHRELQDHQTRYNHKIGAYADDAERHKILVENAADIAIDAHYDWLPVIPNVSQLNQSNAGSIGKKRSRSKL